MLSPLEMETNLIIQMQLKEKRVSVKDKDKEPMKEKEDLVLEDSGQDKHEEITKPWIIESYRPPVPFSQKTCQGQT